MESGIHSVLGEVDSELFMETEFVQQGSITFTYKLSALKSAGSFKLFPFSFLKILHFLL